MAKKIINDQVTTALKAIETTGAGHWFPGMGKPVTMDTLRKRFRKVADIYTGVAHTRKPLKKVEKLPVYKPTGDKIFDSVSQAFGQQLAARIIACALIKEESLPDTQRDGKDWNAESVVRFTIGVIKRMRRQAIENGQRMSWEDAVERLEMEQVEGRHYTFKGSLSRAFGFQVRMEVERNEWADVETFRKTLNKGVDMWSVKVEAEAERLQERNDNMHEAVEAKVWVESFMNQLTAKRRAWFGNVLSAYRKGTPLTTAQSNAISRRYTPEGVKPREFMELVARYA